VLHEILASISANEPNFSTLQRAAKHVDEFAHRNLPRITQRSILADFDDPWVFQEKRPGAPTSGADNQYQNERLTTPRPERIAAPASALANAIPDDARSWPAPDWRNRMMRKIAGNRHVTVIHRLTSRSLKPGKQMELPQELQKFHHPDFVRRAP
jgi:hypothetical protein